MAFNFIQHKQPFIIMHIVMLLRYFYTTGLLLKKSVNIFIYDNNIESETDSRFTHFIIDINCRSFEGETPLWWAAKKGHHHIVQTLVEGGADPNISNNEEGSPLLQGMPGTVNYGTSKHFLGHLYTVKRHLVIIRWYSKKS